MNHILAHCSLYCLEFRPARFNPTPIPSPKWEGGLPSTVLFDFGYAKPKRNTKSSPPPFGGGDGGGLERAAQNTKTLDYIVLALAMNIQTSFT